MKNRLTSALLITGIVITTIAITSWIVTLAVVARQRAAADAYVQEMVAAQGGASGLENAPALLKRVFLAAGERDAIVMGIIFVGLGLIIIAVGLYCVMKSDEDREKGAVMNGTNLRIKLD